MARDAGMGSLLGRSGWNAQLERFAELVTAAARESVSAWMPIESEPKDMASRLYRVKGFCVQGFMDATGVLCAQNDRQAWRKMHGKPTHWAPLLAKPRSTT